MLFAPELFKPPVLELLFILFVSVVVALSTTESSKAELKRSHQCVLMLPSKPALPKLSVAGEARVMMTPFGVFALVQRTKRRDYPCFIPPLYSPTT